MKRYFNVTGACNPKRHYMVNIQKSLEEIKKMVDRGEYFTINRARQYGKTTTLMALAEYLKKDYVVISLDFQKIGNEEFNDASVFSISFAEYLIETIHENQGEIQKVDKTVLEELYTASKTDRFFSLRKLFSLLSKLCAKSLKPIVLIIDEVDSATNNQVFLDFLAQLRGYFLTREKTPTFQSVILAGVYDVKNIKSKIRTNDEHKINSPWNIAADFKVDMSFSKEGIEGMLNEYESDNNTGMNVQNITELLYEYTSGYPFLVSRLCKLIDEDIAGSAGFESMADAWTKEGFLEAVKILLAEKNTLFESLMGKLYAYPNLEKKLYSILFDGKRIIYNPDDSSIDIAVMFGFVKKDGGAVIIANRIFEMRLYNYFLATDEAQNSEIFNISAQNTTQFICNGHLDMDLVLKKFVEYFDSIYGECTEEFSEDEGRRRFLLYLRPIINGTGNYYIEAETRNARRMDVVIDYLGEQFIIELKVWRGNAYNERGEKQLSDYLDYFRMKKGYMLSYNFNKNKEVGIKKIKVGDKILIEAVV